MVDLTTPAAITAALAARPAPCAVIGPNLFCAVCDQEISGGGQSPLAHKETCPWRRAREFVIDFGREMRMTELI